MIRVMRISPLFRLLAMSVHVAVNVCSQLFPSGSTKRVRTDVLSSDDSPGLGFSGILGGDDEGR